MCPRCVRRTAPISVSASQTAGGGESACTPDSVRDLSVRWRPSISAGGYPTAPAAYPGSNGRVHPPPAWPCSGWGLPSHPGRPGCWCALTAPFHPYLCAGPLDPLPSAVCSLLHFPAGHPDWALPSILPCGVRTFLGRITTLASGSVRGHPADSPPPTFNSRTRCLSKRMRRSSRSTAVDLPRVQPRGHDPLRVGRAASSRNGENYAVA
jgi:hypothetical protein